MAKIKIEKSAEIIAKEEKLAKIEAIKNKSTVSNADIKALLLEILEKLEK